MDLKERAYQCDDWIKLAQVSVQWLPVVKSRQMNLLSSVNEVFHRMGDCHLLKNSAPQVAC
jgi:hypothetical protein